MKQKMMMRLRKMDKKKKKFDHPANEWDENEDNPKMPKELKNLFENLFKGGGGDANFIESGNLGMGVIQFKPPSRIKIHTTVKGERDGLFRRKYVVEAQGFDPIDVALSLEKAKLAMIGVVRGITCEKEGIDCEKCPYKDECENSGTRK